MNFEDQLKSMTIDSKTKEMEEKLKTEERQRIHKQKQSYY